MTFPFNARKGLIIVRTEGFGRDGSAILSLALDTGASNTLINPGLVVALGFDLASSTERAEVTTASGIEYSPSVKLDRVAALGMERIGFSVLTHTLPPSTGVDGLLGLDFFRERPLILDFRSGEVRVE